MTTPLIKENERDDREWRRKCKDAVNAIISRVMGVDTTTNRPKTATTGQMFYDTTLGKPIWRHSTGVWKDAAGTTV